MNKITKGLGMNCPCGRGKFCRYNKAQWSKDRKSVFKKLRKEGVDYVESETDNRTES